MPAFSLAEHIVITLAVVVFHMVLLRIGGSPASRNLSGWDSERRLWRRFVGLHFLVLVVFANATLVLPRAAERAAALIAISLIAVIHLIWRRGIKTLSQGHADAER